VSIFLTAGTTCPTCGAAASLDYPASINAGRRPDLRAAVLDGSLYTIPCRSCGEALIFEPHITYLDIARRQWILAIASTELQRWREAEQDAMGTFALGFGADAPEVARRLGEGLTARLVFGWPALIEKLVCGDLGYDDITVELVKLALLRDVPGAPLDSEHDLRLLGREAGRLRFAWVDRVSGAPNTRADVPADIYAAVHANSAAWADAAATVATGLFIDIGRVLHAGTGAAA
jgi:hypothetical protein